MNTGHTDRMRQAFRALQIALVLFSLIVLLIGCTAWKEPKNKTWDNAPGAEQHERSMWQAMRDKHWTEVEHRLAPMFVGVDPEGQKFDRAGWVEHWKNVQIRDLSLGELSVQPNGADMVITYELHLDAIESGHPFAAKGLRVISVWQELKKGWTLTAQSVTPVM